MQLHNAELWRQMLYRQQLLFAMDFTASDPAKLANIPLRSISLI